MKKILFLLSIVTVTMVTPVLANVDSTNIVTQAAEGIKETIQTSAEAVKDGVNYVDTSSTFKQFYSDIKYTIASLAASLKVGAEHVYTVLVRQQIVRAVVFLILLIIGSYIIIKCIKEVTKPLSEYESERSRTSIDYVPMRIVLSFIGLFLSLIIIMIGLFNIDVIVGGFINPEYGAIKEIIDIVKTKQIITNSTP